MRDTSSKIMARLLLRVYFAAFAALPLSSIHIDDIRGAHVLVAGDARQEHNVLLFLHRIFSAHFENRSDHCSATDSAYFLAATSKRADQKFPVTAAQPVVPAPSDADMHAPDGASAASPACHTPRTSSDARSLSSGLSPPAA